MTVATIFLTAFLVHVVYGWSFACALTLGAALGATDPVKSWAPSLLSFPLKYRNVHLFANKRKWINERKRINERKGINVRKRINVRKGINERKMTNERKKIKVRKRTN